MKKLYCSLMIFSAVLTGCGNVNETSQHTEPEYDSYVVFKVEDNIESEDFDDAVRIIENRVTESCPSLNYNISPDFDSKIFRLDFDCTGKWSELFIENLVLHNSVDFRKGGSLSDPIVMDKDNILNASFMFLQDNLNWGVMLEFDEKGSSLFADLTGELANTGTPVSIWVNDELVFAPLVSCAITDGKAVITGNFTEQSAEELTEKIRSEFLPYSVTVEEYKLAENFT